LDSLVERELNVYYVTRVLKQDINIISMCLHIQM